MITFDVLDADECSGDIGGSGDGECGGGGRPWPSPSPSRSRQKGSSACLCWGEYYDRKEEFLVL